MSSDHKCQARAAFPAHRQQPCDGRGLSQIGKATEQGEGVTAQELVPHLVVLLPPNYCLFC